MSVMDPAAELLAGVARRRVGLASGIEIALLDWGGAGPLALLHHANGFCAGVWGLVAHALRGRFRVVALDARGHGESSKPTGPGMYRWERFAEDLLGVADVLVGEEAARGRPARIALGLGHSFGGTAILTAAARRPGMFERIVLVDPVVPLPPGAPMPPEREGHVATLAQAARERNPIWPSREAAVKAWAAKKFFAAWRPEALALYAAEGLRERADGQVELKCPGEVEAAIFEQSGQLDVFAEARALVTPALFLWAVGGDFPRAAYERLASLATQARVEDIEAGHLAVMERPDLVFDAVARFVEQG